MSTLKLQDVRSIPSAEIDLTGPITLLTGDNEEGKTSVLLALKAVLTGETACINIASKYDADGMCADGATKQASAILDDGEGQVIARWSKTKSYPIRTQKSVAGLPHASKTAAGLPDFLSLEANDRVKVFLEAFQVDPNEQDLTSAITQVEIDVSAEDVWNDIVIHGWDGTHTNASEALTAMKADWRAVTAEEWTKDKAEDWAPDCMDETGVTGDQIKKLEQAALDAASKAAAAKAERDAIMVPPEPGDELTCPHCSKTVVERGGVLQKLEKISDAQRERLVHTRNAMSGKVAGLQEDARNAETALNTATALAARSEEDREQRIKNAAEISEKIKTQMALVEVLGLEGVRGRKRDEMLHLVNGQLEDMAATIGMENVRLVWEPDPGKHKKTICARMGDRLYQNLSSSQQWRVRLLIQILIAKRDGSTMLLLDDCEILVRQRRLPLTMLLKQSGINVVAAMSISDGAENAPDFEAA